MHLRNHSKWLMQRQVLLINTIVEGQTMMRLCYKTDIHLFGETHSTGGTLQHDDDDMLFAGQETAANYHESKVQIRQIHSSDIL